MQLSERRALTSQTRPEYTAVYSRHNCSTDGTHCPGVIIIIQSTLVIRLKLPFSFFLLLETEIKCPGDLGNIV